MMFVEDPRTAAPWWAALLDVDPESIQAEGDFRWFTAAGIEFGFHPADDDRNPRGGSPVAYLLSTDLAEDIARAIGSGAVLHRGPLAVDPGRTICQLVDPFGTVFGIDARTQSPHG
jgi:predicted enzyme related to lactoylglutathione lyase